jgi:hypothetical protein
MLWRLWHQEGYENDSTAPRPQERLETVARSNYSPRTEHFNRLLTGSRTKLFDLEINNVAIILWIPREVEVFTRHRSNFERVGRGSLEIEEK